MSTTQKEIASTFVDCSRKNVNSVIFNLALLASIVVFSIGTTIYFASVNTVVAYISLITLFLAVYPVYKLNKLRAVFLLAPFALGLIILAITASMLLFLPTSESFLSFHVFLICLSLIVASLTTIAIVAKRNNILINELSALLSTLFIMSLSVLLMISFKDSNKGAFRLQFWKGIEIQLNLPSLLLTFIGLILISIGLIMLVSYFFMDKKERYNSKYLTYLATFSALSVVFKLMGNAVSGAIPSAKFTFVYIPWVASGIVLDPLSAIIATGIGDFLGQVLIPSGGPWFWLTAVSNMLFSFFPALIFHYIKTKGKYGDYIKLTIGMILSSIICTLGLGTLAITIMYDNTSFLGILSTRPIQLIVIVINYILLLTLLPILNRKKVLK